MDKKYYLLISDELISNNFISNIYNNIDYIFIFNKLISAKNTPYLVALDTVIDTFYASRLFSEQFIKDLVLVSIDTKILYAHKESVLADADGLFIERSFTQMITDKANDLCDRIISAKNNKIQDNLEKAMPIINIKEYTKHIINNNNIEIIEYYNYINYYSVYTEEVVYLSLYDSEYNNYKFIEKYIDYIITNFAYKENNYISSNDFNKSSNIQIDKINTNNPDNIKNINNKLNTLSNLNNNNNNNKINEINDNDIIDNKLDTDINLNQVIISSKVNNQSSLYSKKGLITNILFHQKDILIKRTQINDNKELLISSNINNIKEDNNIDLMFNNLWKIYPRKINKVQALKTFTKKIGKLKGEKALDKGRYIYKFLVNSISLWKKENRKLEMIPHFSSWLNANIE
jgi:hypothetical protein